MFPEGDMTDMGKIINEFHFDRLMKVLEEDHQGTLVSGGKSDRSKCYI